MQKLNLKPSPRLWVDEDTILNLKDKLHSPYMHKQARRIIADADWLVRIKPIGEKEAKSYGPNCYMHSTRTVASHFQCLTAAWVLTHEKKYHTAAIRHLANLLTWKHVSGDARLNTPADKVMGFSLSYGEHCADIALMYDVFKPNLTSAEQKVFFDLLNRFYLKEALACLDKPQWWAFGSSNWNAVCSGGMGQMALAFYDDLPDCQKLIPFVEKSLAEYFQSFVTNGGGNHEGTGYWNYGMHYAMRYLLSWENATGRRHPAFKMVDLSKSLNFPVDFTGITFGDNDGWHPGGFFFKAAKRLKQPCAAIRAASYLSDEYTPESKHRKRIGRVLGGDLLYAADDIPSSETINALKVSHARNKEPVVRIYKGLDWACLADDSHFPSLRLTARGGSSEINGHGMLDLLSFKCMVNGEAMIADQSASSHIAFSKRGHHLYDRSSASKSTLFIDGLGCMENGRCDTTEIVKGKGLIGIRIDGSHAYLIRWKDLFIGRLLLFVEGRYWLVIDRLFNPDVVDEHLMEARFHTFANCILGKNWARLKKGKEQLTMTFASLEKSVMQESKGTPFLPHEQTTIIRWMSAKSYRDNLMVTALNPGSVKLKVGITQEKNKGFSIDISGPEGYQRNIRISSSLKIKRN